MFVCVWRPFVMLRVRATGRKCVGVVRAARGGDRDVTAFGASAIAIAIVGSSSIAARTTRCVGDAARAFGRRVPMRPQFVIKLMLKTVGVDVDMTSEQVGRRRHRRRHRHRRRRHAASGRRARPAGESIVAR